MDILFVADPLVSFKTFKDSTYAMMVEAVRRGHRLWASEIGDLRWTQTHGTVATAQAIDLVDTPIAWFTTRQVGERSLASFSAVLMRKDPPFDANYLNATYLLELAEREGARIFNRPQALRDYNEKLAIARFPQFTAPTLVASEPARIRHFLAEHGDIIIKPLDAMGGASIFRLRPDDANISAILEVITHYGQRSIMAQRYLPAIKDGDKRILIIDGEAVPFCLARIPAAGETRGNLAVGGTGVARPLSEHDWAIARTLGPQLKADGLFLVGLDVIGDCLTEVNVTSPTCFREITAQTDCDVAALFIAALERRCA